MNKFTHTYNFRITSVEGESKKRKNALTAEQLEAFVDAGKFEKLVEKEGEKTLVRYKRKPFTVSLDEPSVLEGVTDPLVKELILNCVKDYVRAIYVDCYAEGEIPAHDWATIVAWREENARTTSDEVEFTDEDAATCANIFSQYWAAQGKAAVGQLFANLCTEMASWAAVKKLCTPKGKTITKDIVIRYRDKFQELADGLKVEQPAESALMQVLADKLNGHAVKRFDEEDPAAGW